MCLGFGQCTVYTVAVVNMKVCGATGRSSVTDYCDVNLFFFPVSLRTIGNSYLFIYLFINK